MCKNLENSMKILAFNFVKDNEIDKNLITRKISAPKNFCIHVETFALSSF